MGSAWDNGQQTAYKVQLKNNLVCDPAASGEALNLASASSEDIDGGETLVATARAYAACAAAASLLRRSRAAASASSSASVGGEER